MAIRECALKSASFKALKDAYDNREKAALKWKAEGKQVAAELGCDVPDEFLMAAGMLPVRVYADPEKELKETNKYLEFSFDPVARAHFEKIVDGTYAGIADTLTVSNSTDVVIRMYLYLREIHRTEPEKNIPETEFIDWLFTRNFLHMQRNEHTLSLYRETVNRWAGREVTDEEIKAAAAICNRDKAALRKIGELRHGEEVRVNGSEALVIIGSAFFMEREEHAKLVEALYEEAKEWPVIDAPRIFYTGSNQETTEVYDMIEANGVVIVGEDHDWGDRFYDRDFNTELSVIRGVVDCYMLREYSSKKSFTSCRVEALDREVAKTGADGVIFYMNKYEEAASWDYPEQKKSLEANGKKTAYFSRMEWPAAKNEGLAEKIAAFADEMKGGKENA